MISGEEHPGQEAPWTSGPSRQLATPSTWSVLTEIVGEAWDMDAETCRAHLDRACAGDDILRAEAESLLAEREKVGEFLEEGAEAELFSTNIRVGQQVGPYQIEEQVGEGATGFVFRATDSRLGRTVALKIFKGGMSRFTQQQARFLAEARTIAALNHPHIITVYEAGTLETVDYIAMEYVDGVRLDCLIAQGSISMPDVLKYAEQIAEALAKAHAFGVIHRDLKPGNIIISKEGLAKVLDFGLAKRRNASSYETKVSLIGGLTSCSSGLTLEGTIMGTPSYMSPEQARGEPATERSDVFSFGALLYEMVAGRKAFASDITPDSLQTTVHSEPQSLGKSRRRVPSQLQLLIRSCLQKSPERRPSGNEVLYALKRLRTARRWPLILTTCALLAGAAVLLLLFAPVLQRRTEPQYHDEPPMAIPLTSHPGREGEPALSLDAKMVAYSWTQSGGKDSEIYVREFPRGRDRKLTGNGSNTNPVWSRDGQWIAYQHGLDPYSVELHVMRSDGTQNHALAKLGPFIVPPITGLAWSPNGKWLVVSDVEKPGEPEALFRIDRRSGEKKQITTPPHNNLGDVSPIVSWSGDRIAFTRLQHFSLGDIWTIPIDANGMPTAAARQLTHQNTRAATPAWVPGDQEIVFHSGFDDAQLLKIRADGRGQPQSLRLGDGCQDPSIAQTGDIVFTRQHIRRNIYQVSLNSQGLPASGPQPVAPSTRMDQFPRFLSDGKRVVFQSNRNGFNEIWMAGLDGSDPVALTSLRANSERPQPSPDGSIIAFESNLTGTVKLYTIPVSGGQPKRLTEGPGVDKGATWSDDGQWIYFSSNRGGRSAIYRVPAGGGSVELVATGTAHLTDPVVFGGYLYFSRREKDQSPVWRQSLATGHRELVTGDVYFADYGPSIHGLYYSSESSGRRKLLLLRPGASQSSVVLTSEKPMDGPMVSKNGKCLLFFQVEDWSKNLFFSKLSN